MFAGGPSIIFHRFHERLKTYIRGNTDKPCMKIFGVDANCLYLGCLMMGMPTGFYTRRLVKNNFRAEETHKYGYLAREWLSWYEHQHDTKVIQKFTNGFEFRVGGRSIPVDGYIRDEKKVLQFQGCIFHGHNCHLTRDKDGTPMQVNPVNCKTIESLRKDTAEISQYIRDQGYELIEMWECQWHREKKINPELRNFVNTQFNSWTRRNRGEQSMEDLVLAIQNGDLFGLVECDISVEEKDREFWEEMPPIFKNTMVGRDAISPLMKSYAEEHGLLKTPKRMLVGSMFGEKILLATPLLQFYIKSGLKITKIYQTIEYEAKTCFKHVGERVCDARRKGDADPDQAIIAEMEKLMGNSFYGKTATNQELFKKVQYFNAEQQKKELHRAIAHHSFLDLAELDDNYVEVSKAPKSVKIDLPLQIAFFVYQYAKLRMLQFYKDFMCEYFKREDFQYLSMDTDSAYVAFSADHWETLIKPEKREQYEKEKHKWFPRDDTPENAAYDRRTPLLFKEEWCGNGFVGLCSKTYYCYNGDNEEKHSCKGLQKRKNAFDQTNYLDVLTSGVSGSGTNTGFITRGTNVYTYAQNRNGLSYFYPKRYVMDDAISTTYINV